MGQNDYEKDEYIIYASLNRSTAHTVGRLLIFALASKTVRD